MDKPVNLNELGEIILNVGRCTCLIDSTPGRCAEVIKKMRLKRPSINYNLQL